MRTFPSLIPSTRPFTGGQWTTADHQALSGGVTTVLLDLTERGRRWTPTFEGVDQDTWEAIRDHWEERPGPFEGFEFETVTLPAQWTPAGYWWRWASAPQASDPYQGIRSVACEFQLVPIVRRGFGGERFSIVVQLVPGDPEPAPTPPVAKVFGGERFGLSLQLETSSRQQQPGRAMATTASLAPGDTVEGALILPGGQVTILAVELSQPGWLRVYASAAAAAADASRVQTTRPPVGQGIISDPALEAAGRQLFSPPDVGFSQEQPRVNSYPFRFTNLGTTGAVTIVVEYSTTAAGSAWL